LTGLLASVSESLFERMIMHRPDGAPVPTAEMLASLHESTNELERLMQFLNHLRVEDRYRENQLCELARQLLENVCKEKLSLTRFYDVHIRGGMCPKCKSPVPLSLGESRPLGAGAPATSRLGSLFSFGKSGDGAPSSRNTSR